MKTPTTLVMIEEGRKGEERTEYFRDDIVYGKLSCWQDKASALEETVHKLEQVLFSFVMFYNDEQLRLCKEGRISAQDVNILDVNDAIQMFWEKDTENE